MHRYLDELDVKSHKVFRRVVTAHNPSKLFQHLVDLQVGLAVGTIQPAAVITIFHEVIDRRITAFMDDDRDTSWCPSEFS